MRPRKLIYLPRKKKSVAGDIVANGEWIYTLSAVTGTVSPQITSRYQTKTGIDGFYMQRARISAGNLIQNGFFIVSLNGMHKLTGTTNWNPFIITNITVEKMKELKDYIPYGLARARAPRPAGGGIEQIGNFELDQIYVFCEASYKDDRTTKRDGLAIYRLIFEEYTEDIAPLELRYDGSVRCGDAIVHGINYGTADAQLEKNVKWFEKIYTYPYEEYRWSKIGNDFQYDRLAPRAMTPKDIFKTSSPSLGAMMLIFKNFRGTAEIDWREVVRYDIIENKVLLPMQDVTIIKKQQP